MSSKFAENVVRAICDAVQSSLAEQYAKSRIAIDFDTSKNEEDYIKAKKKLKEIYMGNMTRKEKNAFVEQAQVFYNAYIAKIKSE